MYTDEELRQPFKVIDQIITPSEADQVREFYNKRTKSDLTNVGDYSKVILGAYANIPSLFDRIKQRFPDFYILSTHFFEGSKKEGTYSGWHTGINISKAFVGHPLLYTLWIPLQDLNEETGGRLWFYNGRYLDSVVDILRIADKKNILLQYYMIDLIEKELDTETVTEDCDFGDAFMFKECFPHMVDTDCVVDRSVLSIRLIHKSAKLDEGFIDELQDVNEKDAPYNMVETYEMMLELKNFVNRTKGEFLRAVEEQQ